MVMGDKADYNVNVEALAAVDAGVLAALRVGQRLKLQPSDSESPPKICSEEGLELAPLADPKLAARFYNPKVMVKSIKRDPASGSILQLQVRLYRNSNAGGQEGRGRGLAERVLSAWGWGGEERRSTTTIGRQGLWPGVKHRGLHMGTTSRCSRRRPWASSLLEAGATVPGRRPYVPKARTGMCRN